MKKKILIFSVVVIVLFILLINLSGPSEKDKNYIRSKFLPDLCEKINNYEPLELSEELLKYTVLPKYENCVTFAKDNLIFEGNTAEIPDPSKLMVEFEIDGYTYYITIKKNGEADFTLLSFGYREPEAPLYGKTGRIR